MEKGLPECQTSQEKIAFFQQLFELTDIVLDGFRVQLDSIKATPGGQYADVLRQYENERDLFIESFSKFLFLNHSVSFCYNRADVPDNLPSAILLVDI